MWDLQLGILAVMGLDVGLAVVGLDAGVSVVGLAVVGLVIGQLDAQKGP